MQKILLCPPDFYDIEYEINPWMHRDNKVDKAKVQVVYKQVKDLYSSLGVEVFEIEPVAGLPDMVYTANFGNVVDGVFIRASFKYPERQKESDYAQAFFEKQFGYKTVSMPAGINFEGQGDLLTDGTRYFFGWGKRSDRAAIEYLKKYISLPILDFETVNPYYYHLDTCFAPLRPDLVVINPKSFTETDLQKIRASFATVIEANDTDNKVLACNMVEIGSHIVVGAGISAQLRNTLEGYGYTVHEIDTSEYIKGGGSMKCISFEF